MAGPGGGPPRRSHTKSRKGCENCKRRHIRCDENFPQCRNCTKHKVRCPYNDVPTPDRSVSPEKPDLMWNPTIEARIEHWQQTEVFPFQNLNIYPPPNPQRYSLEDLRLIYHVAAICDELGQMDANGFTLWTRQIPLIIKIAASYDYVMNALLAFSASHIATETDCPNVGNMAFVYRGKAFQGLQAAITTFSQENSDAVLAATLVLSWQSIDWRNWSNTMQGSSAVITAMESWKDQSQFIDLIVESSTFPTAPPSPTPEQKAKPPCKEDLDAFESFINHLGRVEAHLKPAKEYTKLVRQLSSFLRGAQKVTPIQYVSQQFDRLQPLRSWLLWLPVKCLKQFGAAPEVLLILAHYYTAAILMERLFPEIGAAYFGNLSIAPIEEIARRLFSMNLSSGMEEAWRTPVELMRFPTDRVAEFRDRRGWSQPSRTPSFPDFDQQGNFSQGTPCYTDMLSYGQNPAFSWSAEDCSVINVNHEQPHTTSPLTVSSPFTKAPQFLSIPSPSLAGYSPVSSTFEDSLAYSDNEELGPFNERFPGFHQQGPATTGSYGLGHSTTNAFCSPSFSVPEELLLQDFSTPSSVLAPQPVRHASTPFLQPISCHGLTGDFSSPLSVSAPQTPQFLSPRPFQPHHRHSASTPALPVQSKNIERCGSLQNSYHI